MLFPLTEAELKYWWKTSSPELREAIAGIVGRNPDDIGMSGADILAGGLAYTQAMAEEREFGRQMQIEDKRAREAMRRAEFEMGIRTELAYKYMEQKGRLHREALESFGQLAREMVQPLCDQVERLVSEAKKGRLITDNDHLARKVREEMDRSGSGYPLQIAQRIITTQSCAVGGPEGVVQIIPGKDGDHRQCMVAYDANDRIWYKVQFIGMAKRLIQAGCPLYKSRNLEYRIPIVELFYREKKCELADGRPHIIRRTIE